MLIINNNNVQTLKYHSVTNLAPKIASHSLPHFVQTIESNASIQVVSSSEANN